MTTDTIAGRLRDLKERDQLKARIAELEHHEATTIGLWATDRPDLITDPSNVLFRIGYPDEEPGKPPYSPEIKRLKEQHRGLLKEQADYFNYSRKEDRAEIKRRETERDTLKARVKELTDRLHIDNMPDLLKAAQTFQIENECYRRGMARHYEDDYIAKLEKQIAELLNREVSE